MNNILYALVIWGVNSSQPICLTGWDNFEQCEAAIGIAISHGRKDLTWNCVPYRQAYIGQNVNQHIQCGFGGR